IVYMGCDFIGFPDSNPIDNTRIFVRQHYYDFLGRQPDQSGWDFWSGTIDSCNGDPGCIEVHRINGSKAFFESIEFQSTGYYVYRLNKISFVNFTSASGFTGPYPRMEEFFVDQKKVTMASSSSRPDGSSCWIKIKPPLPRSGSIVQGFRANIRQKCPTKHLSINY